MAPCPAQTGPDSLVERQRVQRVQVDVSVIDPRGDDRASVPGLPRDAFLIRLDGAPLDPSLEERVEFDEICGDDDAVGPSGPVHSDPPAVVIVLVDLNFLDTRMRHNVGRAIERLAEIAERSRVRVKVIGFGRRLVSLLPDFTTEPEEIRRAARRLVAISTTGLPLSATGSGPGERNSSTERSLTEERPEQFGRENPSDPAAPRPAIVIDAEFASGQASTLGLLPPELSPLYELAHRDVDPRPSLAAIEAVMLSHSAIRGRKALVLFSSAWFDLPEELWLSYIEGPRLAAQAGFTIWAVDSRGLAGSSQHSRLLGHLASTSGGETVPSAGRLAVGFERALRQMSCYYLFSVPVEQPESAPEHHFIDVRLDSAKYPELWHFRVRARTGFTLLDPQRQRQRRRLAALMEPEGYRFPELRVSAGYPAAGPDLVTPIDVSVLLSDLTFLRDEARSDLVAEFTWEGSVSSARGKPICTLGDGRRRSIRSESPPLRHPPTRLVLRSRCPLPGPGLYEIRVVLDDLVTGDVGAATALLNIADPRETIQGVSSVRLGRNTGRDFLLDLARDRDVEIPRDSSRRSFTPLQRGEGIEPGERLVFRFVSCNDREPPRVILYRARGPDAEAQTMGDERVSLFRVPVDPTAESKGSGQTCREFEGRVPEDTLAPGLYGLAFVEKRLPIDSLDEFDRLVRQREAGAFVEFEILPAQTAAPTDPTLDRSRLEPFRPSISTRVTTIPLAAAGRRASMTNADWPRE